GRPPCPPLFPCTTLFRSATAWASADAPAAEAWALSLSRGAPRDDALSALLPRRAAAGEPLDGRLLAAFSNAEARQNAVVRVYPRSEEHTSELQSRENLVC